MSTQVSIKRISDYFSLPYRQGELPFLDVDIFGDMRLYVDPRAIRTLEGAWATECVSLLQNFFDTLLSAIRGKDTAEVKRLLSGLHEPNETHLGLSRRRASGRGVGSGLAQDVWNALSDSAAALSGLLTDLEDSVLLIPGIDRDIISDITTNIIRGPLIRFTQDACSSYGIPLEPQVESGPVWNSLTRTWSNQYVRLPVTNHGKLLLVPKIIVRKNLTYNETEYLNHYVLTYLQGIELSAGSELVELLKHGRTRVTKKSVRKKYGDSKADVLRITQQYPEILGNYQKAKASGSNPLQHEEFRDEADIEEPRWDDLFKAVREVDAGIKGADDYHDAVEKLLSPLFYPSLEFPKKEYPIHDGRKVLDIIYVNMARSGFFQWVAAHYEAPNIIVECKNYSGDPKNPELDQLAGRFSASRGRVGLLLCRSFQNKELFLQRCRDTAQDGRGFIIPLDDADLCNLVSMRKQEDHQAIFQFLKERFDRLVM